MSLLLAILWGSPPTPAAWKALSAARVSLGLEDKIEPARALQGSPGRILAIGKHPDWLCEYAYLMDLNTPDSTAHALGWCFGLDEFDDTPSTADQLSSWMNMEVVEVESG